MSTTGHETEFINVQGLQASLRKGGNKAIYNEATCSTAATTAAKEVTLGTTFNLVTGATILVKFTNAITVANATLTVTHTPLGASEAIVETAKPIYYKGSALAANIIKAGMSIILRYNGTQFDVVGALGMTDSEVDEKISTAINALDASVSQSAGADGLALSVTETNGKVTSISGSVAPNTYDAYGAASTAKSELLGDAATDYNTLGKLEDKIQAEESRAQASEALKANAADVYTKSEVNSLITTPGVNYVNVEATNQTTAATDVLPATGAADTIYKIGCWNGTQYDTTKYTEYTWNGTTYIPLATRDHGVDDLPTVGSNNLVKSGGVFDELYDINECTYTTIADRVHINSETGDLDAITNPNLKVKTFSIEPNGTYYANGRTDSGVDYCSIAYYDENQNYIGYELGGGSADDFHNYKLTIPQNAKYVKVQGNINPTYEGTPSLQQASNKIDALNKKLKTRGRIVGKIEEIQAKAILLSDGSYVDSVENATIYTFELRQNVDEYYATGRRTNDTAYCSIAYYDENQNYLGYEIQGGVAGNFANYKLTIPQNAKYVKIWANTKNIYPSLKQVTVVTVGTLDEISERIDNIEEELNCSIAGKTIAIIGSSIHTGGNDGEHPNAVEIEIMPEDVGVQLSAYLTYEDVQGGLTIGGVTYTSSQIGTEITFTPTAADIGKKVGVPKNYNPSTMKVWWKYLIEKFGCTIIPVCWSGAGFTRNRQGNNQYVPSYAWHDSQIRKCGIRTPGTMNRTAPDIIILARGTNDMSYEPYARLTDGYFDNPNWQYPTDDSVGEGIYGFKEGIMTTISKLRSTYPFAKILICTTTPFKRVNYSHFPTNNGLYSQPQYNEAYKEVAEFCGIDVIDFAKCGITWENMYPTYISDSSTTPTHPNAKGHEVMAKCAIETLKNINFDL